MHTFPAPYGKCAAVFTGYDGRCHFMNPIHENSGERPELSVCEEDLLTLADQNPWWGAVCPANAEPLSLTPYLQDFLSVIRDNCKAIEAFAAEKHRPDHCAQICKKSARPFKTAAVRHVCSNILFFPLPERPFCDKIRVTTVLS